MSVSRAMRRLFRVLHLEEDEHRRALESALGELHRLERALAAASEHRRQGRELIASSAHNGDLVDRLAGIEETRAAARMAAILAPRLAEARRGAEARRAELLDKRVERRQAGTLIRRAEDQQAIEALRRGQQSLDDWYLNRRRRDAAGDQENF
jgi:hypothetical protein